VSQVLLIEDDAKIRTMLVRALSERGHAMSSANTAMSGLRQAVEERPDVVILDLGLPDLDGREVLRMLRAVSRVPVIVATARDDEDEIVRVLDAGADDYVTKPFGAAQLDARIRAVLRRSADEEEPDGPIEVGELRVDPRAREAALGGVPLELSPREFDLLHYLALRPGEVVSKRDLLTDVWRVPYGGADKTVDVHLAWLRRKLGETAQRPRYVHTVRGVGVKLVEPDRPTSGPPGRAPDRPAERTSDRDRDRTPDRSSDR
jgi:two-component system, OmpR family, KDP operon response regulator KdpE